MLRNHIHHHSSSGSNNSLFQDENAASFAVARNKNSHHPTVSLKTPGRNNNNNNASGASGAAIHPTKQTSSKTTGRMALGDISNRKQPQQTSTFSKNVQALGGGMATSTKTSKKAKKSIVSILEETEASSMKERSNDTVRVGSVNDQNQLRKKINYDSDIEKPMGRLFIDQEEMPEEYPEREQLFQEVRDIFLDTHHIDSKQESSDVYEEDFPYFGEMPSPPRQDSFDMDISVDLSDMLGEQESIDISL